MNDQSRSGAKTDSNEAGCQPYKQLLTALFDGEATPDEARQARAHLRACRRCALLLGDWSRLRTLFWCIGEDLPRGSLLPRILSACRLQALLRPPTPAHRYEPSRVLSAPIPAHLHEDILRRTIGPARGGRFAGPRGNLLRRCALVAAPSLVAWLMLQAHVPHPSRVESLKSAVESGTSALMAQSRPTLQALNVPAAKIVAEAVKTNDTRPVPTTDDAAPAEAASTAVDVPMAQHSDSAVTASPVVAEQAPAALPAAPVTTIAVARPRRNRGKPHFAGGAPNLPTVASVSAAPTPIAAPPDLESVAGEVSSISDSRPEDVRHVVDDYRASVVAPDATADPAPTP